jgi:hypothetical protein
LEDFVPLAGSAASSPWDGEEWKTLEDRAPGSKNRKNDRVDWVIEFLRTIRARSSKKQKLTMQSKVEVEGVERKSSGLESEDLAFKRLRVPPVARRALFYGRQDRLLDLLIWTWLFSPGKDDRVLVEGASVMKVHFRG